MGIQDEMAAYCLDGAVVLFGTIVEGKLLERNKVGEGKTEKSVRRWTLKQILADGFTFPREDSGDDAGDSRQADGEVYDEVR